MDGTTVVASIMTSLLGSSVLTTFLAAKSAHKLNKWEKTRAHIEWQLNEAGKLVDTLRQLKWKKSITEAREAFQYLEGIYIYSKIRDEGLKEALDKLGSNISDFSSPDVQQRFVTACEDACHEADRLRGDLCGKYEGHLS